MKERFDVIVIGAGVTGCAVARELTRYRLRTGVIEKELDVACQSSGRNSGVLHSGFTYKTGSLKAQCCVEGNQEFDRVAAELDVPFKRTGKVVVGFDDRDMKNLLKFKAVGEANGVRGLTIIDKARLYELEPGAEGEFAMYCPDSGILDPMQYTIALAENAAMNGAEFFFGNPVRFIEDKKDHYLIRLPGRTIVTRWIINCAGLYSAQIADLLGSRGHVIRGFKGEYFVLDKKAGKYIHMPVYPAPKASGGFATHATPTVDGNVLIGSDSYAVEDFEEYAVTKSHLDGLIEDGSRMFPHLKREFYIRNFAGIRAKRVDPESGEVLDFLIERREEVPRAVNLIGIESPGLTSALPLARRVIEKIKEAEDLKEREDFNPIRKGIPRFSGLSHSEQEKLISENRDYGEIICRCESVTRAEILQAIHNPLGVHTLTGIKNRTRASMGRCQGGYCETRMSSLIREELGKQEQEILYSRPCSYMFIGKVRG